MASITINYSTAKIGRASYGMGSYSPNDTGASVTVQSKKYYGFGGVIDLKRTFGRTDVTITKVKISYTVKKTNGSAFDTTKDTVYTGIGGSFASGSYNYSASKNHDHSIHYKNSSSFGDEFTSGLSRLSSTVNDYTGLAFCIVISSYQSAERKYTVSGLSIYIEYELPKFYLDLNGMLDGQSSGGIAGYGTADVYINGSVHQYGSQVSDFYWLLDSGTKYEIKNIKATDGHQYVGVSSGSLSGTIGTENVNIILAFETLQQNIYHGNAAVQAVYIGNTKVKAVYIGNTKVFE